MKWSAETNFPKPLQLVIDHDELVGFYLYVYDKGFCIEDDLQDTLDWAKTVALEDYHVPLDAWAQI